MHGFWPRTDIDMGRWGFTIELDYDYARKLVEKPILPAHKQRLNEAADAIQKAVFKYIVDWEWPRRRTYQFWEDTCLLTNMTVEPGNACGLDMEHDTFQSVRHNRGHCYRGVIYLPHNVDTVEQAAALLAVFNAWYDVADLLISGEAEESS